MITTVSEDAIRKSARKIAQECTTEKRPVTLESATEALIAAHKLLGIVTPNVVVVDNDLDFVDRKPSVEATVPHRTPLPYPLRLT